MSARLERRTRTMPPALALALVLFALLASHCEAEISRKFKYGDLVVRQSRELEKIYETYDFQNCRYRGAMYASGARVATDEPCLRCRCVRGTLLCYLRVCAPLPDPPPPNCILLLKKDACCSELKCEDGSYMQNKIARIEADSGEHAIATPYGTGCLYRGTVYASGSAMSSSDGCRHCFCIAGREQCVRPTCLSAPPGCRPLPARACCPPAYECDPIVDVASAVIPPRGCLVKGVRYPEGSRVDGLTISKCDNCFCMKGLVRCAPMACAPSLMGCKPIVKPGQCCPDRYDCSHSLHSGELSSDRTYFLRQSTNHIGEFRSFQDGSDSTEIITTSKNAKSKEKVDITTTDLIIKNQTITEPTTLQFKTTYETTESTETVNVTSKPTQLTSTTKTVKNVSTPMSVTPSIKNIQENTSNAESEIESEAMKYIGINEKEASKIVINGTINCTAEITSSPAMEEDVWESSNVTQTMNDTESRTPNIDRLHEFEIGNDAYKSDLNIGEETLIDKSQNSSNDIITLGDVDNMFMINVSTVVRTNSTSPVTLPPVAKIPPEIEALLNISMKDKEEDYEYDYNEPKLPPSLPNLKIIPFVAADAVVDHEEISKDEVQYPTLYPLLDREDKFSTIFTNSDDRGLNTTLFLSDKEEVYSPTQYPIYKTEKVPNFPLVNEKYIPASMFPDASNNDEVKLTTSRTKDKNNFRDSDLNIDLSKFPVLYKPLSLETSTKSSLEFMATQSVNKFSPPQETEGGFIPKDPPLIDEYYAVRYTPSTTGVTPEEPLTTLPIPYNKQKGCVLNGQHYDQGDTTKKRDDCLTCICFYGEFHCRSSDCPLLKAGCKRVPHDADKCCGLVTCNISEKPSITTHRPFSITMNPAELITISDGIITTNDRTTDLYTTPQTTKSIIELILPILSGESINKTRVDDILSLGTNGSNKEKKDNIKIGIIRQIANNSVPQTTQRNDRPISIATSSISVVSTTFSPINLSSTHTPDEYDEDEEEDEEFSFGNVLKLLLSDNYDTTTRSTVRVVNATKDDTSLKTSTTTTMQANKSKIHISTIKPLQTVATLKPKLTNHSYLNKHLYHQPVKYNKTFASVNKLNKLSKPLPIVTTVLPPFRRYSESPTLAPANFYKKPSIPHHQPSKLTTTLKPQNWSNPASDSFGVGTLKLAGCNIYGMMYRIGRIIVELSNSCLQCMCTEIGVQCKPLNC